MDDQTSFISSRGNVAVFTGFDPDNAPTTLRSSASTRRRDHRAALRRDLRQRCGDPVRERGETLSTLLWQSKMLMQPPMTDIIQQRLSDDVTHFTTKFGWEPFVYPRYNQLYLNIRPTCSAST